MLHVPHIFRVLGWNKRPLTYDDFLWACDELGIRVQRTPTQTRGMFFECRGEPIISLSARLLGVELWHTAFHELAHSQLHAPGLRCFSPASVSKAEAEAEALAVSSVLDEPSLIRIVGGGELHDYPRKLVMARIKLRQRRQF